MEKCIIIGMDAVVYMMIRAGPKTYHVYISRNVFWGLELAVITIDHHRPEGSARNSTP